MTPAPCVWMDRLFLVVYDRHTRFWALYFTCCEYYGFYLLNLQRILHCVELLGATFHLYLTGDTGTVKHYWDVEKAPAGCHRSFLTTYNKGSEAGKGPLQLVVDSQADDGQYCVSVAFSIHKFIVDISRIFKFTFLSQSFVIFTNNRLVHLFLAYIIN